MFEVLIRFKGLTDLEIQLVKDMVVVCCFVCISLWTSTFRSASLPTSSFLEVAEDGSQLAWDLEEICPSPPTSEMLHSTGDSIITPSNGDITVATEDKSDTNAKNYSETEEIPKVSLDHELSKENPEETIQLIWEVPEILSDNVLERMVEDENEEAICNLDQVHDASVFCPYLKSTKMDSMMAQGIFQK